MDAIEEKEKKQRTLGPKAVASMLRRRADAFNETMEKASLLGLIFDVQYDENIGVVVGDITLQQDL